MSAEQPQSVVEEKNAMYELLCKLYPLHRTINSDDFERALGMVGEFLGNGFKVEEHVPGEKAYTWEVPYRYAVEEAYIECDGERYAEFSKNSLSLVSYSISMDEVVSYKTLQQHVYTCERQPEAIPWMFKYYDKTWGFCMPFNTWKQLSPDKEYRVVIKSRFESKPFLIGEYYVKGQTDDEILWVSDLCHPNQVNDSISGAVVAAQYAKECAQHYKGHYSIRFLFLAETIGSIVWFANHEELAKRIHYGLFCEMLGNNNRFQLKLSRQGNSPIDSIAKRVFNRFQKHGATKVVPFKAMAPGNDEKVMNGIGLDIPTISFTRWPYPEYHTSADNPSMIDPENLDESLHAARAIFKEIEESLYPVYLSKGPIFLTGQGLWVSAEEDPKLNRALQVILFLLDGKHSVRDIAEEVGLDEGVVHRYLNKYEEKGLIRWSSTPC